MKVYVVKSIAFNFILGVAEGFAGALTIAFGNGLVSGDTKISAEDGAKSLRDVYGQHWLEECRKLPASEIAKILSGKVNIDIFELTKN